MKLVPAFIMLLVSAILVSTASYAWFSMNTAVTATGMQVTAKAESGIVISNSTQSAWTASAATTTGAKNLLPTSTTAGQTWYHSASKSASAPHEGGIPYSYVIQGTGLYSLTTDTTFQDGVTYYTKSASDPVSFTSASVTTGDPVTASTYYVLANDTQDYYSDSVFYIKSSTTAELTKNLEISSVSISTTTLGSTELNKSIRVLVKVGDFTRIYRLTDESTATYTVAGGTSVTAYPVSDSLSDTITGVTVIPASTGTPITVHIFVYFEGESANCISNNVTASLDTLNVSVQFTAVDP